MPSTATQPSALEVDSATLAGDKENIGATTRRRSPVKAANTDRDLLVKAAELGMKVWNLESA